MKRSTLALSTLIAAFACADSPQPLAPTTTTTSSLASTSASDNLQNGAVYTSTDELTNRVIAYYRDSDGSLVEAGRFPTGGSGSGLGSLFGQGGVILSGREPGARVGTGANHLLFAVNAGSNSISVFRVEKNELVLVETEPSNGIKPISLTLYQDVLYVLHQTSGSISGFNVTSKGELTPIAGSTRTIAGGPTSNPAQVGFSNDGSTLVVSERETGLLNSFVFDKRTGLTGTNNVITASGQEPFGFEFDNRNHLFLTDGFFVAPGLGGASSYDLTKTSQLVPISGDVKNGGTDTCWLIVTNDGRFVYTHSFGDSRLSSYKIDPQGNLVLFQSIAALTGVGPGGFDIALTIGSQFLYAVNQQGTIRGFEVNSDGTLTPRSSISGLPPSVTGLAVR